MATAWKFGEGDVRIQIQGKRRITQRIDPVGRAFAAGPALLLIDVVAGPGVFIDDVVSIGVGIASMGCCNARVAGRPSVQRSPG